MTTTITADNGVVSGSAGLKSSADGSGALDIQTGSGTTAISISATQAVTIPGTLTVTGGITTPSAGYILNSYVAPATWTKPTGLKAIKVTVVGAGGAGGPAPNPGAGICGGGGAGGAAIYYAPAPSIPGPVAITAGAGTNSFGALASATAGSVGSFTSSPGTTSQIVASGGAGGTGSGGTLNINGGAGMGGTASLPGGIRMSGSGGNNILGNGGQLNNATSDTAGSAATGYGAGGAGAMKFTVPSATIPGGAASPGIVIVEEFY